MTDAIIDVSDVAVTLGDVSVLESVSLSVAPGEFLGVVGPNGAGKTTLLRTINGVLEPDRGRVTVDGLDVHAHSSRAVSRHVATVPQDTSVRFDFTTGDLVRMGRTPYQSRTRFGLDEADRAAIERALDRTETAAFRERLIGEISGGERQRAFLARALAQETPALLLDEPTASLDINHQIAVLELVASLVEDGLAAVAAIHDLDLAARFCDRIVLLADGAVRASGPPETVFDAEFLEPTFETSTVVTADVVTGSPSVTALDGPVQQRSRHVHVVGGGEAGRRTLATLWQAGFDLSAGVLREGDVALRTARELDVDVVTTSPHGDVTSETLAAARDRATQSDVTVLADVDLGPAGVSTTVAEAADHLVVVEDRPLDDRTHGSCADVRERYERLRNRSRIASIQTLPAALSRTIASDVVTADD